MLAFEILGWIIFIYGLLSLIRDLINEYTYSKLNNNMKIYITIENVKDNAEYFIREICNIKRKNLFRNITVINMDEKTDEEIEKKLKDEDWGFKILDYKYIKAVLKGEIF